MSSFIKTTPRRARKRHECSNGPYGCRNSGVIAPGDLYAEHVAAPNHCDLGNTRWWRLRECADCCAERGRPIATEATS